MSCGKILIVKDGEDAVEIYPEEMDFVRRCVGFAEVISQHKEIMPDLPEGKVAKLFRIVDKKLFGKE